MVKERGRRKEGKMGGREGRARRDKEAAVRKICSAYTGNGNGIILICSK